MFYRFVGLHFFNPVQMMKLVEVVKTEHTSQETFDQMMAFTKKIGKQSVACKDTPGFIVNRLLVPFIAQAMSLYGRGDASIPDIDLSMQLGTGHPMGPLHLSDYIGLDTIHHILVGWKKEHPNDPAFFVPQILDTLVRRGDFGRKSGKGFYKWEGDKLIGPAL
jgi:3-hydroxyacyl-CoA dehydrogenase